MYLIVSIRFGSRCELAPCPILSSSSIANGCGNRRVVVSDKNGHFFRQWGRQDIVDEVDAGVGGVFLQVVYCVVIGRDGLVVCDRLGDRVEVFDKMGNFKRNILIESKTARLTGISFACWLGFSPDQAQKFMIVGDCADSEISILDRATGHALSSFGRPGKGEFGLTHSLAVNSKGDVIVSDSGNGRRTKMWRLVKHLVRVSEP